MLKLIILGVFVSAGLLALSGCSVFGKSGVEIAPYSVLRQDQSAKIEIRHYERLVLVSTPMVSDSVGESDRSDKGSRRGSFGKLFDYISGENQKSQDIPMTAPVFMDQESNQAQGQNRGQTMSFVLPTNMTMETAPRPQDPAVTLEEIKDHTVAVITFSGMLDQSNIDKHIALLKQWMAENNLKASGGIKAAGYNPPFTIPALRRNEILIPIAKPDS